VSAREEVMAKQTIEVEIPDDGLPAGYEFTGEFRRPRGGDYYLADTGYLAGPSHEGNTAYRLIVRKVISEPVYQYLNVYPCDMANAYDYLDEANRGQGSFRTCVVRFEVVNGVPVSATLEPKEPQ
jgi:hypothetical protein